MRYLEIFDLEREILGSDLIRLENMDFDTTLFRTPKIFSSAVNDMFEHNTLTYSDFGGFPRFKKLVREIEGANELPGPEPMVFAGAGISAMIRPALEAISKLPLMNGRDEVILFAPEYSLFYSAVVDLGLKPKVIWGTRENNFQVEMTQIENVISGKTLAVLFSNPNNPTCCHYDSEWQHHLSAIARKFGAFIISDEVYRTTMYSDHSFEGMAKANGGYQNLLVFFGPSKDRPGFTGLRCGYCIGDPSVEESLREAQVLHGFSNSIISDYLFFLDLCLREYHMNGRALEELEYFPNTMIEEYVAAVEQNRRLAEGLRDKLLSFLPTIAAIGDFIAPTCGNSLAIKLAETPDEDFVGRVHSKGVSLYPGRFFLFEMIGDPGWTRLCLTRPFDFIAQGLRQL